MPDLSAKIAEIRARFIRPSSPGICKGCLKDNHPAYERKYHGYCLDCANAAVDERDDAIAALLSAHDAAVADNARLLRMACQCEYGEVCEAHRQEHPGAALLAQHVEELAKRDAELSRAKRALRGEALVVTMRMGALVRTRCQICKSRWAVEQVERHSPVQLPGDAEPGKCPAAP